MALPASLKKLQPLIALVVMVVALTVLSDKFLTVANQRNILLQISVNLCLSIGMTLVILTGGIDLSVGAILALAGAVAAGLLKHGLVLKAFGVVLQFTPFGAVLAGIGTGLALGWFNGLVITRFKLPPFVATLGMLSIGRGLTMLWTGGFPITDLGPRFGFLGAGMCLGVPMPVWISAALVALFYVISRRTTLGRYIYAVGGSEKATAFSGINVNRVKL
ncbi:MAG: ABC transporter permease, partial [Chthoniobacter sp.]|nr:ABC transporter permease [Chthoniobacter sp.]